MDYKSWLEIWLSLYVKPKVKGSTFDKYEWIVSTKILPALGGYEMEELTLDVLQRFVVGLGFSPSTVNIVITIIHGSLKRAVLVGAVGEQHSYLIQRPKLREKKVECFSVTEQNKIEKAVTRFGEPREFGIILCLYTGLRIGELLALEWKDVDLRKGLLTVNKTCRYAKDGDGKFARIIDTPKTEQSNRVIPLPRQLLSPMRKLKNNRDCESVVSSHGEPVHVRAYQNNFEALLCNLRIPHRGFHALRHTFATRALECGMDVKTLSEILGHKNPNVTLSRYAHSMMEYKSEMMNKLGERFRGNSK